MHIDPRTAARAAALLLGLLALGGCEQELPTETGGELLPEAALRTYEVILADETFLAGDSLLRGFGTSELSTILVVAEDWLDTLDAHALVQFGDFPETVTFVDSGAVVTDTVLRYLGGRVVLRVDTTTLGLDTLGTDTTIVFELYQLAEGFDARTATWTARSVSGNGDTTFWATPGGTPGALLGTESYTRSDTVAADSMVFELDSATVATWAAGDSSMRAVMVRTTTAGARTQVAIPRLQLTARTVEDPDTTRVISTVVQAQTYVIDPPPPAPVDEIRVGDRSAWRTFLMFTDALDTVTVACPNQPGCSFTLGEVTVNRAELRLTPLFVSPVYRPRGNITLEARPVLGEDSRPLERAPLGDTTGVAFRITPAHFEADSDSIVRLGVTRFVRGLLDAGGDTTVTERNRTLAFSTAPEPLSYGIARFGALGSGSSAPVLRLIVTVPVREEEE